MTAAMDRWQRRKYIRNLSQRYIAAYFKVNGKRPTFLYENGWFVFSGFDRVRAAKLELMAQRLEERAKEQK